MAIQKRIYGIKFPFTIDNEDGYFIDLDKTLDDKVASDLIHVILTPKRSRIRKPDFGTDLIKFIFDGSDETTYDAIKDDIVATVAKYVNNTRLDDIKVYRDESDDNATYVVMKYAIVVGGVEVNKELGIKI